MVWPRCVKDHAARFLVQLRAIDRHRLPVRGGHQAAVPLTGDRRAGCRSSTLRRRSRIDKAVDSLHSAGTRSEEHTSELQSHLNLVCRLLLEKKKSEKINLKATKSRS